MITPHHIYDIENQAPPQVSRYLLFLLCSLHDGNYSRPVPPMSRLQRSFTRKAVFRYSVQVMSTPNFESGREDLKVRSLALLPLTTGPIAEDLKSASSSIEEKQKCDRNASQSRQ